MKNLKKVLALVMAFAMAFTMFAGAVDFSDVKPGDDYSAAISMLSDLEVVSGNGKGAYEPAKAVTRAEACVLIANMMNGGKADTARFAGGSNFSDVAHGWWGESAIAYCVQNGITYGVGGGKFAPMREISDAEFVAMMTRAMGYDTAANPLSFPYGNYTAAVNNGLLDNMPYAEKTACTKGESAQIIYDALFADYARLTANLNVIHNADDHDNKATLIHDVFGLEKAHYENAKGNCVAHEWVITGVSCEDEDVITVTLFNDDKTTEYSKKTTKIEMDCTADVESLIGYKVALWGEDTHSSNNDDGEIDTVLAVEVLEGQKTYAFNPTMDIEDDLGLDDKKWDDGAMMGYDGDIFEKNGNDYALIDWDDDGEIDYIKATERFYGTVEDVTAKKVIVKIGEKEYDLELADGETKDYECDYADEHDYVVELDAEEGDVVEVMVSDAYESTITISITTVESTEMEFTKWNSKGDRYFDDVVLEDAGDDAHDYITENAVESLEKDNVDSDYNVWVNYNGFVIDLDPVDGDTGYAMILAIGNGEKKSQTRKSTNATADIMLADGTIEEDVEIEFECDVDAKLYNEDTYKWGDMADVVGAVFEYSKNDDGEIDSLTKVDPTLKNPYLYREKYETLTFGTGNTVELTGEDFVFVVDKDYVENDDDVLTVDTDLVLALSVDEIKDIDREEAGVISNGAYKKFYGADTISYPEDQTGDVNNNSSDDKLDGVVLSVKDIDRYLGTSTAVGLITDIEYDGNYYTFEMVVDGDDAAEFTSVKVKKSEDLDPTSDKGQKAIEISPDDARLIEEAIDDGGALKLEKGYSYGLYAYIGMNKDNAVDEIELLVEKEGNAIVAKADTDCDYVVTRGVIASVAKDASAVEIINPDRAVAYDDETLENIDEYLNDVKEIDVASDVEVYVDAELPGMKAGEKLNDFIAFDKDSDFSVGSADDIEESYWRAKNGLDEYVVADLIADVSDDNDIEVVAAYIFASVDEVDPDDKKDAEDYKNQVKTDIEAAWGEYETAKAAYDTAVAAVTARENDVANLKADAAAGRGDDAKLAQAESNLKIAQEQLAEAKAAVNAAAAKHDALVDDYNELWGANSTKVGQID